MQHIKYLIIIILSICLYGCSCTKQIKKDNKKIPVVENVTHSQNEQIAEAIETNDNEIIEVLEHTEIEDNVQTDYVTVIPSVDHSLWNTLLQKHVSNYGNVNYKGFKTDNTKLNSYLKLLSENPPKDSWNTDEKLAYWINVYNANTVKLIIEHYPIESIKKINNPWSYRFIKIDKKWYTLNDIEHRIIRKMNEPRIHFALVCAAVSCPRLYNKAFTAKNLEADLDTLTREFLNDTSKNELSTNTIKLSKLFKWYGSDFKNNKHSLIDFLNQYSTVRISDKAKKSYKAYNWNLNE